MVIVYIFKMIYFICLKSAEIVWQQPKYETYPVQKSILHEE